MLITARYNKLDDLHLKANGPSDFTHKNTVDKNQR